MRVTSLIANNGLKGRSPYGPHGHPGLRTIGGAAHFNLYTRERVVVMPKQKVAGAAPKVA